ncbi:amidohydrolase [Agromyces luteolus]|uniref:Peptidase M20 domain-containing protein 2 n=1 Tax=Agromyces luteolus TaxID=88373 RepID=A0A7C9LG74_9MICO|nr:amidohydrolase [Agromyces luteolus]MUN06795.1 amidohydrolase [Agromyces luteolus]GLK27688.1 amidohydrolase [Agromyces luteolus]
MTTLAPPRADLRSAVRRLAPGLLALSHDLHAHPEPAWGEHRSSRRLAAYLAGAGLEVELPAYGLPTAFRATAGTTGPLVVLCCEYDALPGLGHGCGHNVVAAAAAGAAAALAPLAGSAGGRVVALGTPAEEGGGGKIELLRRHAFDGAAAALLVHPGPHDQVRAPFRAAASSSVLFRGRAAHAAMAPGSGRNALDAAVFAYQALGSARSGLGHGEQVTAVLVRGGTAPNVVPEDAELRVMTRAGTTAGLERLADLVARSARAGALATGCTSRVVPAGRVYRELRTDRRLAASLERHLRDLGRSPRAADPRDLLTAGSTDLGNVSHVVPVAHPKLAIGDVAPHSRAFTRAAGSPAGDRAVLDGATLLALTVLDVWASRRPQGEQS